MNPAIDNASARQRAGEPSVVPSRGGGRNNRSRNPGAAGVESEIAALINRPTQDLRLAWRQSHHTGPPPGLSRDLMIRVLAHQLQERTEGGASQALRRRLRSLAGEFEKGGASFDPGIMPKTGTIRNRVALGHLRLRPLRHIHPEQRIPHHPSVISRHHRGGDG